ARTVGAAELAEFTENVLALILGDADAGIPNLDAQGVAAPTAADQHAAAVGIADRVGDEIEEDAAQQETVARDPVFAVQDAQAKALRARRNRAWKCRAVPRTARSSPRAPPRPARPHAVVRLGRSRS